MAKSGLSTREREILQDEGYTGVGQEGKNFNVWVCRIKKKIKPTLSDAILILKHGNQAVELTEYLTKSCRLDLVELHELTDKLLKLC